HLTTAFFAQHTGTNLLHVPYKGSGEMLVDVVNGLPLDTSRAFTPIAQMAEFINVLIVRADSPIRSATT
ncbi:ABC transporter substrate-binding protein, partial [Methylobacterium radiotolerans]